MTRRPRSMASALWIAIATAWVTATTVVWAQVCDPKIYRALKESATSSAQLGAVDVAMARLKSIEHLLGQETWDRVARQALDIVDSNVGAGARVTIHDVVTLTLNGTDEQIAAVFKSLDRLAPPGTPPIFGTFNKPGPAGDGSSAWIIAARNGNRGNLYEIAAIDYLIATGQVNRARVRGMGFRTVNSAGGIVEGDLVTELVSGKLAYIDVKAANGNYSLSELDRVDRLIRDRGEIDQFFFANELVSTAPANWLEKLEDLNRALAEDNLPQILFMNGGPFPNVP